ncbi:WD40 repeat domain-containing protein [Stieleria varia]|uniref:WD domain, G-beta repeat n=1 Tax=Stieleria varia TaxID=2528005 RepID=A0A5C6A3I8_9BACT|nr:WD40 repeat domain-containing protein [Stieleria varia]TWT94472.1 WD domain, G-beta repeat [Stieleria varia]
MIFELLRDFSEAIAAFPKERPDAKTLGLLQKAIRRESHFLEQHPTTLFQTMWNQCWWHDGDVAASSMQSVNRGSDESETPDTRKTKLFQVLETWRSGKQHRTPGFIWLRSLRPPANPIDSGLIAVFRGHTGSVNSIDFSSDGCRLASGASDGSVKVWDLKSGVLLQSLIKTFTSDELAKLSPQEFVDIVHGGVGYRVPGLDVHAVAWSRDDRFIATASHRSLRIWDSESGTEHSCFGAGEILNDVAWSPCGQRLVTGGNENHVCIWDPATGDVVAKTTCSDMVTAVRFVGTAEKVLAGCFDGSIVFYDWKNDSCEAIRPSGQGRINVLEVASSFDRAAWGLDDGTFTVWNVQTKKIQYSQKLHSGVRGLSFSPDGLLLAVMEDDGSLCVFSLQDGSLVRSISTEDLQGGAVAIAPDGLTIACTSGHCIAIRDMQSDADPREMTYDHGTYLDGVELSPDGRRLVTVGRFDPVPRLCDGTDGKKLRDLSSTPHDARFASFSPDGQSVVVVDEAGLLSAFDVDAVTPTMMSSDLPTDRLDRPLFAPDGNCLACGSREGAILIWDWPTKVLRTRLDGHKDWVNQLAFDTESQTLVSCAADQTVRVWDLQKNRERLCIVCESEGWLGVTCVAISGDGKRVASGGASMTVSLWDANDGRLLNEFRGHRQQISQLAFTPDGRFLLSASQHEPEIMIWDLNRGSCVESISGTTDLSALAIKRHEHPWRWIGRTDDSLIETMDGKTVAAWFPRPLASVTAYPSGRIWAGSIDNHLCIVAIEGNMPLPGVIQQPEKR